MISYEKLHELLYYNPNTGIFTWKFRPNRKIRVGQVAGIKRSDGYIQIRINSKSYLSHRLAWLYVHGYFPEYGIDHIDRDPTNNRIENLREASNQCNIRNTGNRKDNVSGIKGICWYKPTKKWRVQITINNKKKHLGYYENFADAVKARYNAEKELNWSGCDGSSPAYKWLIKNNFKI